jgi:hypothetical protein
VVIRIAGRIVQATLLRGDAMETGIAAATLKLTAAKRSRCRCRLGLPIRARTFTRHVCCGLSMSEKCRDRSKSI